MVVSGLGANAVSAFLNEVRMIVAIQFVVVAVFVAIVHLISKLKQFIESDYNNTRIVVYSVGLTFLIVYALICFSNCVPILGYISIGVLTLTTAYLTAVTSILYNLQILLVLSCTVTPFVASVIIASARGKLDLTKYNNQMTLAGIILSPGLLLPMSGFVLWELYFLAWIFLGAYLFLDTQRIMGDKSAAMLLDPVYAATRFFVDIHWLSLFQLVLVATIHTSKPE